MVMQGVQLLMSRRQNQAIIDSDPLDVVLYRRERVDAPGGGWRWASEEGTALDPQKVCLIPFKRRMSNMLINTELGDLTKLPFVLLGSSGMNIQKGDYFFHEDQKYEVRSLDTNEPEVKTAAEITYFGGGVNG